MTTHRFLRLAKLVYVYMTATAVDFLSPQEVDYLKKMPAARRNLERRIVLALGHTLLSPDQLQDLEGTLIEKPDAIGGTHAQVRTPLDPNPKTKTDKHERIPT